MATAKIRAIESEPNKFAAHYILTFSNYNVKSVLKSDVGKDGKDITQPVCPAAVIILRTPHRLPTPLPPPTHSLICILYTVPSLYVSYWRTEYCMYLLQH